MHVGILLLNLTASDICAYVVISVSLSVGDVQQAKICAGSYSVASVHV